MTRQNTRQTSNRPRYSYQQHGRVSGNNRGNLTIKPHMADAIDIYTPAWPTQRNSGDQHTVFRPLPVPYSSSDPEFSVYRESDDVSDFGDWIRGYPAVKSWGGDGLTWILYDQTDENYNIEMNPCEVVWRALNESLKAGTDPGGWARLKEGGNGRSAEISKPTTITFVQAFLFYRGNKIYTPPKGVGPQDKITFMQLTDSAARSFVEKLNEKNPGYNGDPLDYEQSFRYGDPISLTSGRYVCMFQEGTPPIGANQQAAGGGNMMQQIQSQQQSDRPKKYDCDMMAMFNNSPADISSWGLPNHEEFVRSRTRPWEDAIRVLTDEEQMAQLCNILPATLMVHAFSDRLDEIPEHVRDAAVNRTYGAVPGQNPGIPMNAGMAPGMMPGMAPGMIPGIDPSMQQTVYQLMQRSGQVPDQLGAAAPPTGTPNFWGQAAPQAGTPGVPQQSEVQANIGAPVGDQNTVQDHTLTGVPAPPVTQAPTSPVSPVTGQPQGDDQADLNQWAAGALAPDPSQASQSPVPAQSPVVPQTTPAGVPAPQVSAPQQTAPGQAQVAPTQQQPQRTSRTSVPVQAAQAAIDGQPPQG